MSEKTAPLALGYIRRSVIARGEITDSPEKQRAAIERICQHKGWDLEIYQDAEEGKHYSGRSEAGRPAWQRLKRQLSRPEVVALVVYALDRASRSPKDFFNLLDLLERHHVAIVSVTQPIDTSTAIGRAFVGMAMVIGSLEAEMASERGKANIAYRRSQGLHWGPVRYGYRRDDHRRLTIDPPAAAVVRQIYNLYGTGRYSHPQLAAHLNAAGYRVRTQDGREVPWDKHYIQHVLGAHWTYRGFLVYGHARGDYEHDEAHPPEHVAPGEWEPLLEADQVQQALSVARRRNHQRPYLARRRCYILAPLLVCAQCGQRVYGDTNYNRQGREYHYYRHERGAPNCRTPTMMRAEPLEAEVLAYVRGLVVPTSWPAADVPAEPAAPDAGDLQRRRDELKRVDEVYLAGGLSPAAWRERRGSLTVEIERWQAAAPLSVDRSELLTLARQCGDNLRGDEPEQQRAALGILFARLECRRDNGAWHISRYVVRDEFRPLLLV